MNDRALRLLEQYDLEVTATRRGRGSYILETTEGLRIFSDYSNSENKAVFQNMVMEKLREGGYGRVDRILPDKEGNLTVRDWEDNRYVVKEWYTGRECDTSSEHEVMAAVSNLARIHRLMQLTSDETKRAASKKTEELCMTETYQESQEYGAAERCKESQEYSASERNQGLLESIAAEKDTEPAECSRKLSAPDPLQEIRAQNAELRKIRSFVRRRNDKGVFERQFLQCFEQYFAQAEEAESYLKSLQGALNDCWNRHPGSVCHGDYDHHNILMSGYEIATINFNRCRIDFQVNDLYRFMRKILEKQEWNLKLADRMLDGYMRVKPLPEAERKLLYVKLMYPEKFRKLANYYYGSNKALISRRFMDKLEAINRQDAMRKEFVAKFGAYS